MTRLVLATRNEHKVVELRRILTAAQVADIELVGLDAYPSLPEVEETGRTFAANALLKGRAAATGTGEAAVADDSGLCVDVLGGMPGVLSARWAGQRHDDAANLALLLDQLSGVPRAERGAAFVAVTALVLPDGREIVQEGRVDGVLADEPRGTGGFGYDPVFVPLGDVRTLAELPAAEKDAISHRGQALRRLAPSIAAMLG